MFNILLITDKHHYLYYKLFENILRQDFDSKISFTILLRDDNPVTQFDHLSKTLKNVSLIKYGQKFFSHDKGNSIRYGIKYNYDLISFMIDLRKELTFKIKKLSPNLIITPSSDDISIRIIRKYLEYIPVYYIQHSNIQKFHKKYGIRKKFWNYFHEKLSGIWMYSKMERPPFYDNGIIYLLWSKHSYKDNFYLSHDIRLIPKFSEIKLENKLEVNKKRKVNKILVILNKRANIGKIAWEEFAFFYKEALRKIKCQISVKIHPSEEVKDVENYFDRKNIIDDDFNINNYDLILSHWSTFIYDAAINNIPFILINPFFKYDYVDFHLDTYPIFLSKPKELIDILDRMENGLIDFNKINDEFLEKYFPMGIVNNSSQIIYDIVRENK